MAYTWIERFPTNSPSPRWQYATTWDGNNNNVVLFGGTSGSFGGPYGDTWLWDGTDWTEVFPAHSPSARKNCGIAWDSVREEVVLFGGGLSHGGLDSSGETWTWDGTDWTLKSPTHSPSARQWMHMAFDEARSEVILFGGTQDPSGTVINDTWTWNGTDWTEKFPANPPTMPGNILYANAAYDSSRSKTVMLVPGALSHTFTWDGTDWTHETPTSEPPGLIVGAMADGRVEGKPLQFGGITTSGGIEHNETWRWDGDWHQIFPATSPSQRGDIMLAYDFDRDEIVMFGGLQTPGSGDLSDTWVYTEPDVHIYHLEGVAPLS